LDIESLVPLPASASRSSLPHPRGGRHPVAPRRTGPARSQPSGSARPLRAHLPLRLHASLRQLGTCIHRSTTAATASRFKLNATQGHRRQHAARRPTQLPLPTVLASTQGKAMGAVPTLRLRDRSLTLRTTGAPTAGHLGREALLVHHAPRGQGALPLSPG
jgi:hypothetical protein